MLSSRDRPGILDAATSAAMESSLRAAGEVGAVGEVSGVGAAAGFGSAGSEAALVA
jgi:hypothetical protein